MPVLKGYLEAPRWAGLQPALRSLAFWHDVELELLVEKSWLLERVLYKAAGEQSNLERFSRAVQASLKDYNASIEG